MYTYALPRGEALEKVASYFSLERGFLEELYLATTSEVVVEIPPQAIEDLKENVELWRQGYALPLEVLKEAMRIKEGEALYEEGDFEVFLPGEDLEAEPDSNYQWAEHFCSLVEGKNVLDLAAGFGWVPPILSRSRRVYALDSSYGRRVVYGEKSTYVEGTNIELFPGYPGGRVFLRERGVKTYADFAALFWEKQGANLGNIRLLQEDALNLSSKFSFEGKNEIDSVTCFFGLNHIGKGWQRVLSGVSSLLPPRSKAYFALYSELLGKFPLKGFYDWTRALELEIIPLESFLKEARKGGFSARELRHQREKVYHVVELTRL